MGLKDLEHKLLNAANKNKLKVAGALTGSALVLTKIAGEYLMTGKDLSEQLQNPEQILNYGIITGAATAITIGGVLIDRYIINTQNALYKDVLTEAYNRRAIAKTQAEINLRKNLEPYSIVMLDLDNFKLLNDTLGHKRGDEALKELVKGIFKKQMKRPDDIVVRMGGDEFMFYLPRTDREGAETILKRIREQIKDIKYGNIPLEFSAGIATYDGKKNLDELMIEADSNMYSEKSSKKNTTFSSSH